MATFKNRGERLNGFTFWTNSVFGNIYHGVAVPSLNVSSTDSTLNAPLHFSYMGDSGDEDGPLIGNEDMFITFMNNPAVAEHAYDLIREKVGSLAVIQISNYMERQTTRPSQFRTRKQNMDLLRSLASNPQP